MNNQKTAARTSGRIPAKETALFCTQAGLLLKAGIPLGDGLASLTEEGTGAGRELLRQDCGTARETGSLYEAGPAGRRFPLLHGAYDPHRGNGR